MQARGDIRAKGKQALPWLGRAGDNRRAQRVRKEPPMATRTPEEIFAHHGQALGGEDLEGILAD
jgi:hypothetical protein